MQTVKFPCDKCNNPMQVSVEYAGKQVRCPHCKGVVLAPAGGGAPVAPPAAAANPAASGGAVTTEPMFRMPSRRDDEGSIFEANDDGDDLFDAEPKATLELPPAPTNFPNIHVPPAGAGDMPTVSLPGSAPHLHQTNGDETLPLTNELASQLPNDPGPVQSEIEPTAARRLAHQRSQQESMLIYYLLAFLIPYAILTTIVLVFMLLSPKKPFSPLEILPDLPNDRNGGSGTFKRVDDAKPIPPHLRVKLNETLEVGDIKVTPLKVEQRRITFCYENNARGEQDSSEDAVVLTLDVQNASTNIAFGPNDLFFNRKMKPNDWSYRPYTSLELEGAKDKRFYGGPCDYKIRKSLRPGWRDPDPREYVKGTQYATDISPGEHLEMIVCTDPYDPALLPAVAAHTGPIVYRVQLRRGLYREGNREGTVTAVVGVEFTKKDIQIK